MSSVANPPGEIQQEILPQTIPLQNDTLGTTPASDKTGISQKILATAQSAYQSVSASIKRGRGRPRKDGFPKASDTIIPGTGLTTSEAASNIPPVGDSPGDILFRRSIASAFKGVLSFLKQFVRIKADAAGIESAFTEKTLKDAEPPPDAMADFSESLELVLKKYSVKSEYAPEISLAIHSARIVAPYALLFKTFDEEIKRKREREKNNGNS